MANMQASFLVSTRLLGTCVPRLTNRQTRHAATTWHRRTTRTELSSSHSHPTKRCAGTRHKLARVAANRAHRWPGFILNTALGGCDWVAGRRRAWQLGGGVDVGLALWRADPGRSLLEAEAGAVSNLVANHAMPTYAGYVKLSCIANEG